MAAVMIGGMVPPCAIALATLLFKNKFTKEERESGPVNFIMGLAFITEGAIPFAASDPLHVLPACVVGAGVSGALSMAFGSSFGVAGTAGVILAAIARSGGASLAVTGGAVLSGAYLGERLSPASSSAALTAALAGVEQHDFQLRMWRTTPLPLALSLVFYGGISLLHPIQQVDQTILRALEEGFDLSWTVVLPAVILLVLPFFKVSAARSILVSCGAAAVLAVWEQGRPLAEVAWSCVAGYVVEQPELTGILSGGGLLSMVNGMCIVLLSCASSGILNGAELLEPVKARLERMARRTGLYVTTAAVSVASAALPAG